MIRILIFITFIAAVSCQFDVSPGPNATLPTYLSNTSVISTEPKVVFEKRTVNSTHPVSVFCKISSAKDKPTVKWLMNNKDLTVADRGRNDKIIGITTENNNNTYTTTLTVKEPSANHATGYTCQFSIGSTTVNATVYILSMPIVEDFSKAKRAIQGDKLKITCKVFGFPLPESVTWYFGNRTNELTFREGVEASAGENGVQNAVLRFKNLKFEDRGIYWCHAANSLGEDKAGVLVRAKNRLDALWPFLGIVAEVAILVTLILVYEKKRSSAKRPAEVNGIAERVRDDEEPGEDAPETKDGDKDEDVRQRAAKV